MTLPILHITADHIKDDHYIGPDLSNYEGHVEIAANLGWVKFTGSISVKGHLWSEAGTGIEAGDGIKCKFLSVRLRIFAGLVNWRLPEPGENEIHAEIRNGAVALGTVFEPVKADDVAAIASEED